MLSDELETSLQETNYFNVDAPLLKCLKFLQDKLQDSLCALAAFPLRYQTAIRNKFAGHSVITKASGKYRMILRYIMDGVLL